MNIKILPHLPRLAGLLCALALLGSTASAQQSSYKMFLEAGPAVTFATGDADNTYAGVSVIFGCVLNDRHKFQIEIGALGSIDNDDYRYRDNVNNDYIYVEQSSYAMPILAGYSFQIPLAGDKVKLRLGPTAGISVMGLEWKYDRWGHRGSYYSYRERSVDDSDVAFVYGASAGVTISIRERFYVDAGYRYLRVGSTSYDLWDNHYNIDDFDAHSIIAVLGWKF